MKNITFVMLLGILGGFLLNTWYVEASKPIVVENPPDAPQEVLIEIKINWTEERIREEILKNLPPIFVRVAGCESTGHPDTIDPRAFNAMTGDHGPFQANAYYWRSWWEKEGLDPYDVADAVQIAKHIYDIQGLNAWEASKHCWREY